MKSNDEVVKTRNEEITEIAKSVITSLEQMIETNAKDCNFASEAMGTLSQYIGADNIQYGDEVEKYIISIWQQAGLNKELKANPHTRMNVIRKTMAFIGKQGYNPIINKAEALAEEEMVHRKTISLPVIVEPVSEQDLNIGISEDIENYSWYKRKFNQDFDEFCNHAYNGKNKHLPYFRYVKVSREEILCPLHNHRLCSIDTIKVTPHSILSKEMANLLYKLNSQYIKSQANDLIIKKVLSKSELSKEDLVNLEQNLRPGKIEHIHIVNFMPRSTTQYYEKTWTDMTEQAFITGAVIHGFNYPGIGESKGDIEHKSDFVYAGLAMINKLLDEGIHPSCIILQGYGQSAIEIAKAVNDQFNNNGKISFKIISPGYNNFCNDKLPNEFTSEAEYLSDLIGEQLVSLAVKTKIENLSNILSNEFLYFQLFNMLLALSKRIYSKNPKLRGRDIPLERVTMVRGEIKEKQFA